jgi:hypothetical protein
MGIIKSVKGIEDCTIVVNEIPRIKVKNKSLKFTGEKQINEKTKVLSHSRKYT